MALGINLLFRLGRKVLAEPLEASGWLPVSYYQSQALAALEEDDFGGCLRYLRLAGPTAGHHTRLVAQLLILRCRLLLNQHEARRQALDSLWDQKHQSLQEARYADIMAQEERAVSLLIRRECEARSFLAGEYGPH